MSPQNGEFSGNLHLKMSLNSSGLDNFLVIGQDIFGVEGIIIVVISDLARLE